MRGERPFRGDIEGLRAVAVLAVVLYHAGIPGTRGGYVGVDVFFVVSGFLITGLLWKELRERGRVSFSSFYARRARRLVPTSVLVVAVTLVASRWWLPPLEVAAAAKDGLASALYTANYRFALLDTGYLTAKASPSPFQHYWSLAVEEQFYLLWPVLLVALWRARRRARQASMGATVIGLASAGAMSFAASLWLTHRSPPWAFFSLPTRAWELAVGALIAVGVPVLRRLTAMPAALLGWVGLALVGWSVTTFGASTAFPGLAALAPVGGTAAVLVAGFSSHRWGPARVLSWRPLQVIGRLSYCWYLWHWPALVLGAAAAGRPLRTWERLSLVAASAVLAAVTVVTVEAPVRFSRRLAVRPGRSLALAGGLSILAATGAVIVSRSVPPLHGGAAVVAHVPAAVSPAPVPSTSASTLKGSTPHPSLDPTAPALAATMRPVAEAIQGSLRTAPVPVNLTPSLEHAHGDRARPFNDGCFNGFEDATVNACSYGAPEGSPLVVLFGDSHATHWFPALEPVADARGWRLEVPTKATCPPIIVDVWSPYFGRVYRECNGWRRAVLDRIRAERPKLVILGMHRAYGSAYRLDQYSPVWIQGLTDTVRAVRSTGSRVVVLGPEPHQAGDVPTCLSEHLDNAAACARPVVDAVDRDGIVAERAAVVAAGGDYVDVTPWFCVSTGCPVMVGNLLVYRDQNHITTSYASWLAAALGAQLDRSLAMPVPGPR